MDITDKADLAKLRNRVYLFVGLPLVILLITLALIKEPNKNKKGDQPRPTNGQSTSPSEPPPTKGPAKTTPRTVPFTAAQTKGNVRVTLLRVAQEAVFETSAPNPLTNTRTSKAASRLRVVYLVECLGDQPINLMNLEELKLTNMTGQTLGQGKDSRELFSATDPTAQKIFALPKMENAERARIRVHTFKDLTPVGLLNITIRAGFNDVVESFYFAGVPL